MFPPTLPNHNKGFNGFAFSAGTWGKESTNQPFLIINPRSASAARVIVLGLSFRPSVCLLPRFLPLRATRQQKSYTNWFSATLAIFVKMLRSKVMAWKKLICKLALAYLSQHCIPWRLQRRTSIDSRVLSSSVASLWPTLSELLSDHESVKR